MNPLVLLILLCGIAVYKQPFEFAEPQLAISETVREMFLSVLSVLATTGGIAFLVRSSAGDSKRNFDRKAEWVCYGIWCFHCLFLFWGIDWREATANAFQNWILIDEFIFFLPVFLPLILIWLCFGTLRAGIDKGILLTRNRINIELLTYLLPLAVLILMADIAKTIQPGQLSIIALLPTAIVIVLLLIPIWIARILPSESIVDTGLGKSLKRLSSDAGVRVAGIRIWHTSHRVINGLIVGLLPWRRCVLLTDRLIDLLEVDEIKAVYLHEIAHVKRQHMPIRFVAALTPFLTFYLPLSIWGFGHVGAVLGVLVATWVLGAVSRWLEFDADRFAYEKLPQHQLPADSIVTALQKMHLANPELGKRSWLHPGTLERVNKLQSTFVASTA